MLLALAALLAAAASAPARSPNPAERLAHLPLDPVAYDRAKGCLHRTQPGTQALEAWLKATRARGASWGTESCRTIPVSRGRIEEWRRCRRERKPGERCPTPRPGWSLHAEGRALDWHLDAANEADRAEAELLLDLLLAPDSTGAPNALARRMGLQEVIWNCRAWFAGGKGTRPYGGASTPRAAGAPAWTARSPTATTSTSA